MSVSRNPNGRRGGLKYPLLPGETREEYDRRIAKEYNKKWREKHPTYARDKGRKKRHENPEKAAKESMEHGLRRRYGMDFGQYDSLFEFQNGLCLICGKPETRFRNGRVTRLAVDHCHDTNKVRGLLCSACNSGIAHLQHSPEVLRKAIEYLEFSFDPKRDLICV